MSIFSFELFEQRVAEIDRIQTVWWVRYVYLGSGNLPIWWGHSLWPRIKGFPSLDGVWNLGTKHDEFSSVLCTWSLTTSMVNDADGVIYVKLTVKIVNYAVDRQSLVTVTPLFTIITYGAIFEWRRMCTTLIFIREFGGELLIEAPGTPRARALLGLEFGDEAQCIH